MKIRKLGASGPEVGAIGLGCMGMSPVYGEVNEAESIATVHEAVERGVTLLDTGDFYGMGHNEMLLRRALAEIPNSRRDNVVLSVKFGALRAPDGSFLGFDARPAAVKTSLSYSLQRLGVDHVSIYRPARLDQAVPIEETAGAIAQLIQAGYVKYLGLSEVGVETIRKAHAVSPVVDLQIEYALVSRGPEEKILPALNEMGIGVTAYGVLSRGLLSGSPTSGKGDYRARLPRFTGENFAKNQQLVERLNAMAQEKGVTAVQLAMAWVLAKGENIVPLAGARKRTQLEESLAALEISLSAEEVARLESEVDAAQVAGTRYDEHQMRMLDSER